MSTAEEVSEFHLSADKDGSQVALHHTLGAASSQASPGNHTHDGGSSVELSPLSGTTVTPDFPSVIAALVKLGATGG